MVQPIINAPSYPTTRSKAGSKKREGSNSGQMPPRPPRSADENFIPSPESLSTLIRRALAALQSGVMWDRGSIVNLKV